MTKYNLETVCDTACNECVDLQNNGNNTSPIQRKLDCPCPKKHCPNNGICEKCVIKHKLTDSLPFCLFLDNNGDKSITNYYKKLKQRFEGEKNETI